MSILIAWMVIGAVFYLGVILDGGIKWDLRQVLMCIPCFVLVQALWPIGCINVALKRGRFRRG